MTYRGKENFFPDLHNLFAQIQSKMVKQKRSCDVSMMEVVSVDASLKMKILVESYQDNGNSQMRTKSFTVYGNIKTKIADLHRNCSLNFATSVTLASDIVYPFSMRKLLTDYCLEAKKT